MTQTLLSLLVLGAGAVASCQSFPSSPGQSQPFPSSGRPSSPWPGSTAAPAKFDEKTILRLLERLSAPEKKLARPLLQGLTQDEKRLLAKWTDMHKAHAEPPVDTGPWKAKAPAPGDWEKEHLTYFLTKEEGKTLSEMFKRLEKSERELLKKALRLYCEPKAAKRG